jgi:hypothetical protein
MAVPKLRWDRANGRFRDSQGRFLARSAIRAALDRDLARLNLDVAKLGDDLRAGRISLDQWRQQFRDIIKHVHLGSAAIATGGRAQMTDADLGRVGQIVRIHYQALEGWVQEINAGWVLDGRLASRSRLYVQAGRTTFHAVERDGMATRGFDEERSVLHDAEHCAECVLEAAKGFQPIGQMIPVGSRQCLSNDKCSVEYRNSQTLRTVAA